MLRTANGTLAKITVFLHIGKNVNGWYMELSANEEGKIELVASKTLGSLKGAGSATSEEARVKIIVEYCQKSARVKEIRFR